ncbi:hypothetical protein TNCV_5036721 [Trichonephila clavipes]|nr:hypothetical protein TNCV_5036721 [Trichonephila clavipes]
MRDSACNCYRDGERYADMLAIESHHPPAWLINTCWNARFVCRMALHPMLLDAWKKISCAGGRLVMIACLQPPLSSCLASQVPRISVRAIIGFGVTLKSQVYRDRPTSVVDAERQHPTPECLTITPTCFASSC